MSALPLGGHMLDRQQAVPPREQRILAPSTLGVVNSNMGASQCACALVVTDVVNLTIYYVPMTPQMAQDLRKALRDYDPEYSDTPPERNHN
jgi:hypothetical protein